MPLCSLEEKKYCIFTIWLCPNTRTPVPGIMKLTILVDPFLVNITIYLVCLICAWE